MDEITGDIETVDIDGVSHHFPVIPANDPRRPLGKVDLLCGINQVALHHAGGETKVGNLHLLMSRFGSAGFLDGSHPKIRSDAVKLKDCSVRTLSMTKENQEELRLKEAYMKLDRD